jgi:protein disulfide-isomerase
MGNLRRNINFRFFKDTLGLSYGCLMCLLCWPLAQLKAQNESNTKMKIEIWSDIACPFCYIGQAHIMEALADFPQRDFIQIEWKSFILDPSLPLDSEEDLYSSLSERKGISMQQVQQMTANVKQMAQQAGLTLDFDNVKPVATSEVHKVLQLAKQKGLGNAAKQRFFEAYFKEGANIADHETLKALGAELGLQADEIQAALTSPEMQAAVERDLAEARSIGINGVPYFVLDRKHAMSGAQPVGSMRAALDQAFEAWQQSQPASAKIAETQGASCTPKGDCD